MLRRQHEAEAERERQELEMCRRQQVLEQELATQQRREQEQRHLDELYQEYGPQSAEQHAEDQARNQDNGPNNPNDEPPHNDPVPPVQEPVPPNEPNDPVPQPPPPPPPPPRRQPLPPGGRPYREPIAKNDLGAMGVECQHCHALHFDCEKLSKSTRNNIVFGMCCLEGLVQLPPLPQWPVTLRNLFRDHHFREHIRQYNSSLAFTSLGVEFDRHTVQGSGPAAFRIHGALYHLMGSLIPAEGQEPSYAQLYIYDPQEATDRRTRRNPQLRCAVLQELYDMLANLHPYVQVYKQAYQVMQEKPPEQHTDVRVQLHFSPGTDGR